MIRIRYSSELHPGLNGQAVRHGRTTVVHLLPGLTPAQRAAALRRLRQHGRMGISPRLPAGQLLRAVLADRIRTTFGQAGAIFRTHPAGSTLPLMAVSAAVIGFLVLSAVSIRVIHQPPAASGATSGLAPIARGGSGLAPNGDQSSPNDPNGPTGNPGGQPGAGRGRPTGKSAGGSSGTKPGAGGRSGSPGAGPSGSPSGGTALSGTAATSPPAPGSSPAPNPAASPAPSPNSSTQPAAAATAPAKSAGSSTRVCVSVGPLGLCLGL